MAFSDFQLDDVRERADIVRLVGERVELRKAGKDYLGLCPFHGERSPSFYVVPNKNIYHCFGCGETGDVFKFFMRLDGLGFIEAVKLIAQRAGVTLEEERLDPAEVEKRRRQEELASLLERAVKFYESKLAQGSGKAARDHLAERGVSRESIQRFRLGFGGHAMDDLAKALTKAGVPVPLAVEAGLLIEGRTFDRPFDRFYSRLIVPIRIPRPPDGRTVALGGRALQGITPERHDRKTAKYINSPETPLYEKGKVLFGLDQARDSIRKEERAVIVEGYFDVIGVHQAGLPLAVATCGTSLTPGHLDLLMRTGAKEVVFLFDGDEAGLRAAGRAAELCAKHQVPARVATLPDRLDPDEYARKYGLDSLRRLLDGARPGIEVLIDRGLDQAGDDPTVEDRVRAVQSVKHIVLAAPEGLSRELYVARIAERLKVSEGVVQAALEDRRPPPRRVERESPLQALGPRREPGRARPAAHPDDQSFVPDSGFRPQRMPRPPSPPRESGAGVQAVFARRTLPSEEGIVVSLLTHRVLAPTVAEAGVLADFHHPVLKAVGERCVQAFEAGETLDVEALLGSIEEAPLRRQIRSAIAASEGSVESGASYLSALLDKFRMELRREKSRLAVQRAQRMPEDEEARAAFELELQQQLEESRRIHQRMRERLSLKPTE